METTEELISKCSSLLAVEHKIKQFLISNNFDLAVIEKITKPLCKHVDEIKEKLPPDGILICQMIFAVNEYQEGLKKINL